MDKLLALRLRAMKMLEVVKAVAPLALRLTAGFVFIQTGWGKIHNIDNVTGYFETLKIPMPHLNALVASWTELLGGAALIIGLATRLFSVPLMVTMVVAIITAVLPDPDPDKVDLIRREEFHYLIIFFALAFLGPGPLSLDYFIGKKFDAMKPVAPKAAPVVA